MTRRPFDDMRAALAADGDPAGAAVRLDFDRERRTGVPEIVLGRSKPATEVAASLRRLAERNGRALATRCTADHIATVREQLGTSFEVEADEEAGAVLVARADSLRPSRGGRVGVITAGSSDRKVAAETAVVARELGAEVREISDVGVAGLHRLIRPLESLVAWDPDVIVVIAGMDGALPSVIAGLVATPVIAVPTSTGYGFGGEGVGAMMTMMQSCSPGVVVVNVDNGVGAGSAAALIANRVAAQAGRVSG
jgi:NCAIR mutase (PurE)-related protein